MRVDDLADVRAGDKGGTLILAVLPRTAMAWETLRARLTTDLVAGHFGYGSPRPVSRHEVPSLPGLVFCLPGVLGGGVTSGSHLDGHGKTLSYHLLALSLPPPSRGDGEGVDDGLVER